MEIFLIYCRHLKRKGRLNKEELELHLECWIKTTQE